MTVRSSRRPPKPPQLLQNIMERRMPIAPITIRMMPIVSMLKTPDPSESTLIPKDRMAPRASRKMLAPIPTCYSPPRGMRLIGNLVLLLLDRDTRHASAQTRRVTAALGRGRGGRPRDARICGEVGQDGPRRVAPWSAADAAPG